MRRFSGKKLSGIFNKSKSEDFSNIARNKKQDFVRVRKLTLFSLVVFLLVSKRKTMAMEINQYMEQIHTAEVTMTKAAFTKARYKLKPEAFQYLVTEYVKETYRSGCMKTIKGYYLLAADGVSLLLPTNKETLEKYGNSSRKEAAPQAAMGVGCLYDTINRAILDISFNRHKFDERGVLETQLAKTEDIIGTDKYIITADRGYPSIDLIYNILSSGKKLVFRLSSAHFKAEQEAMKSLDEKVVIEFSNQRLANYKDNPEVYAKLKAAGSMTLRFVKIASAKGEYRYIATNLSTEEFNTEEINEIYKQRWEIETAFNSLKNQLNVESFTGIYPMAIEQDLYASVFMFNVAQDLLADANMDYEAQMKSTPESSKQESDDSTESIPAASEGFKYEWKVNKNIATGYLRENFLKIVLEPSVRKKIKIMNKIVEEVKKHIIPIRTGRQFPRKKGNRAGKFHMNNKRNI